MFCRSCLPGSFRSTQRRPWAQLRHASTTGPRPLKLAIIGAGPSGFYAASRILASIPANSPAGEHVQVDMYERLPTPYGLVRYGVAPDHPEVKNCQHKFDALAGDKRFRYFGNVSVGTQPSSLPLRPSPQNALSEYTYPFAVHVALSELVPHYSALLLTYGASLSNPLGNVAGSSSSENPLQGVYPALALVGWYNGHPAFSHLNPDLSTVKELTVVGHGNVALDIARILLKSPLSLSDTDLPDSVLDVLSKSAIESVHAVGRRGPAQVSFTTKEFREMLNLPHVAYPGLPTGDMLDKARKMAQGDRMKKRLLGLMETTSSSSSSNNGHSERTKQFDLGFLSSPRAFLAHDGKRVSRVEWDVNALLESAPDTPSPPSGQGDSVPRPTIVARPTGEVVSTRADMVVESVGYRSEPLGVGEEWIVPFDKSRGRVRNQGGRVVDQQGLAVPGLYAAGWAARGPVGVIASTMHDAYVLADLILQDHYPTAESANPSSSTLSQSKPTKEGIPEAVQKALGEGKVVTLDKWHKIDQAEKDRAKATGSKKEREKFTTVQDMLAVLS